MTDMTKTRELLIKYNIPYHTTGLYSTETNEPCGWATWLDKGGHFEFDFDGNLTNIVTY